jgi:hypothetical protein
MHSLSLSQVLLVLLSAVGVLSVPTPLADRIVERQTSATALAKLQAVALIKEYDLQDWCDEWILDLSSKIKYYSSLCPC